MYITNKVRAIALLIIAVIILSSVPVLCVRAAGESLNNKRACWISFLDFETYLKDLSEEEFKNTVSDMYDNIISCGMNTVIVHVRAFGDAIYPSDNFPQAEYISSYRRVLDYDALSIMTKLAHEKNIAIEAWINPYRLSKDNDTTYSYKQTVYYEKYRDFTIEYTTSDGETALSLDPSRPETVSLICEGVSEIVSSYDVDGIHFDDYFYMPGMADGLTTETKKENVNLLIRSVYDTVKSINKECTFGISPAGNTENARGQGADIDTWLSVSGYVDYIMPQIYWSDTYMTDTGTVSMFSDRCAEWQALNALDIPIYAGLALYRVGETSGSDLGWAASDTNLMEQYGKAYGMGYDGYALFRYEWLDKEEAASELGNLKEYSDTLPDGFQLINNKANDDEADSGNALYAEYFTSNMAGTVTMEYRVYTDGGWSTWQTGRSIRQINENISAVQICLADDAAYDVSYRVKTAEDGWLMWTGNGKTAGVTGNGHSIEDIDIVIIPKKEFSGMFGYLFDLAR